MFKKLNRKYKVTIIIFYIYTKKMEDFKLYRIVLNYEK